MSCATAPSMLDTSWHYPQPITSDRSQYPSHNKNFQSPWKVSSHKAFVELASLADRVLIQVFSDLMELRS